jgi:hypothetical protein
VLRVLRRKSESTPYRLPGHAGIVRSPTRTGNPYDAGTCLTVEP